MTMKPTIGTRLALWVSDRHPMEGTVLDVKQPFTARVCFVQPDGKVSATYLDHRGASGVCTGLEVREASEGDQHGAPGVEAYCTPALAT